MQLPDSSKLVEIYENISSYNSLQGRANRWYQSNTKGSENGRHKQVRLSDGNVDHMGWLDTTYVTYALCVE